MQKESREGFTLIELSIVLVVIGLLVGGILSGKMLIHAAQLQSTIGQIEKLDSAINAFQLKYNCLPGDCANASSFGFTAVQGYLNGNGDGFIDNGEEIVVVGLLQQAGLISATPGLLGYPILPPKVTSIGSDGIMGSWYPLYIPIVNHHDSIAQAGHYYWATTYDFMGGGPNSDIPIFSSSDAFGIDSKIDDGLPRSGNVLAGGAGVYWTATPINVSVPTFISGTDDASAPGASNTQCVGSGSPDTYNLLNPGASLCSITVGASF